MPIPSASVRDGVVSVEFGPERITIWIVIVVVKSMIAPTAETDHNQTGTNQLIKIITRLSGKT